MASIIKVADVLKDGNFNNARSLQLFFALGSVGAAAEAQNKPATEVQREVILGAREFVKNLEKRKTVNV